MLRRVDLERPGADQGLIEQILVVAPRYALAVHLAPLEAVEPGPAPDLAAPLERQLAQRIQARAHVLAPLVVMGGGGEHRSRMAPLLLLHEVVEGGRADARNGSVRRPPR